MYQSTDKTKSSQIPRGGVLVYVHISSEKRPVVGDLNYVYRRPFIMRKSKNEFPNTLKCSCIVYKTVVFCFALFLQAYINIRMVN